MKKTFLFLLLFIISLGSYAVDNATDTAAHQISIMTWNVKLLPQGGVFLHHHPVVRARLIPQKLIDENADVIVLQEAFDQQAIHIIRRKLKAIYPYSLGERNRKLISYKRAGGVYMFSKYPMKELESIKYSQCMNFVDCYANKGAMLVEVDHPAKKFQVLGTHIQAGGTKEIKFSQYAESGALLKRHEQAGVPQFAAGDFNTKKTDTIMYPQLIRSLCCEDGDICTDLKCTTDHLLNDMDNYNPTKRHIIDYVFFKPNGVTPQATTRSIKQIQQRWNKKHKDLSDHNPVILKMQF